MATTFQELDLLTVGGPNRETIVNNAFTVFDLRTGFVQIGMAGGNVTLTTTLTGQSRYGVLWLTGVLPANREVLLPSTRSSQYLVFNDTTGAFTVTAKVSGQPGVLLAQGTGSLILCDGTNTELVAFGGAVSGTIDTIDVLQLPQNGLHLRDTDDTHDLIVNAGSNLSANRTLTLTTGDANRTLTLSGDASLSGTNTGDQTSVSGNAGSADALRSATTTINVVAATAPTAGQVLTATSGTAATWQTPSGGGSVEKWTTPTSRTTGISAVNLNAGANVLGSAIDNAANLDTWAEISATFLCGSAPTAGTELEVYLLYAPDGTNYQDGDATPTDPAGGQVGSFIARNVTSQQYPLSITVPLKPFKFKILVKSELNQNISSTSLTVSCQTFNKELV